MTTKDIINCLSNCSNNGQCVKDSKSNYVCKCYDHFIGDNCKIDLRLCSKWQCMNNGNCIDKINGLTYSFECDCPSPYYGQRCEHFYNLCKNQTCSNQGLCQMNSTNQVKCVCFLEYSGDKCEIMSSKMKIIKTIGTFAIWCTILFILCFIGFIVFIDLSQIFNKIKPKKVAKPLENKKN